MVSAEARELAGKTAAEIRRRGWTQAVMAKIDSRALSPESEQAKTCRVCLVGGIAAALTGDPRDGEDLADGWKMPPPEMRELLDEIALRTHNPNTPHVTRTVSRVINWNDDGDRTEAEVLAVLDSIAADQ